MRLPIPGWLIEGLGGRDNRGEWQGLFAPFSVLSMRSK